MRFSAFSVRKYILNGYDSDRTQNAISSTFFLLYIPYHCEHFPAQHEILLYGEICDELGKEINFFFPFFAISHKAAQQFAVKIGRLNDLLPSPFDEED
jgi:hypothetical protein